MEMSRAEWWFRKLLPHIAIRYDILVAIHKDIIEAAEAQVEAQKHG